jgi:hypothetical protein
MAAFEAFEESVEVSGELVGSVVKGLGVFSEKYQKGARAILTEADIEDVDPNQWYPQPAWLAAFQRIADNVRPTVLERVGEQVPRFTEWPHAIDSVPDALRSVDEEHQRLHRDGDVGYYRFTYVEERCGEVSAYTPHPCAFDRGLVRGIASENAPIDASVSLEETGTSCRTDGAAECTYTVYW